MIEFNVHQKDNKANLYYACSTNAMRDTITTKNFSKHVNDTHQRLNSNTDLTETNKDIVFIEMMGNYNSTRVTNNRMRYKMGPKVCMCKI